MTKEIRFPKPSKKLDKGKIITGAMITVATLLALSIQAWLMARCFD